MSEHNTSQPSLRHLKNPVNFLAFGFGSGLAPKAPGTFGTLVAIPLVMLMWQYSATAYLTITVALFIVGIGICHYTSQRLGVADHPAIVWDEIVGYMITMMAAPNGVVWIIVGFALFRFFDIVKPWPISWLDKHIHGGLGIMLDDAVAGLLAYGCIQLLVVVTLGGHL